MSPPLDELNTQIDELKADLDFVRVASQLRPRIGPVVRWQAKAEELEVVRRFMSSKSSRPEGVYGPLLVRLLAVFERFVRRLVADVVAHRSASVREYDELASSLGTRNLILTGRVLATLDTPRDHLALDVDQLVENLASCKRGNVDFRLNAQAFCAVVTGVGPAIVEKAFKNVEVTAWWDEVGGSHAITTLLGTKGARATGVRAKERLRELWRWRNQLAHGGDAEVVIVETQLCEAIEFVASLGAAIDAAVRIQLRR